MSSAKKILFAGCGDLARGCMDNLLGHALTAIARRPKQLPPQVTFWQGAITDCDLGAENWDAIVITLTPDAANAEAYREAYWLNTQYILHSLAPTAKPLIIFASSTRVYGQNDGGWVDENSPCVPNDANGQYLLDTETLIRQSGLPHCIVRFSGIYGPARDYVVRQVRAGQGSGESYTNRIHRDDACGLINFLLLRHFAGYQDPSLILASDQQPVTRSELYRWLAQQLGITPSHVQPSADLRSGNKRCDSHRLCALGFEFRYPSYVEGYTAMLATENKM